MVLEQLLRRLKSEIPFGRHLKLVYRPDNGSELSGEVIRDTIYIYKRTGKALGLRAFQSSSSLTE
jgi:hypothetical protein